jgi:hypothetical protein
LARFPPIQMDPRGRSGHFERRIAARRSATTKASVNGNRRLPIETQTRHLIRKGPTFMAKPPPAVQAGAIPDPQTLKEIGNVLDLHRKLEEAVEELKKQRAVAEAELTQLVKYFAVAPLSVDTAIARHKALKAKYAALEAKITDAEELLSVIDERIKELKKEKAEAFETVRQQRLDQLDKSKKQLENL